MLGLAGLPLGLDFRFLDPSPDRRARRGRRARRRRLRRPGRARPARRRRRRRHVRVRERAGRGGCAASRAVPPPRALELGAGPPREKGLFQRLGIPTPRFGSLAGRGFLPSSSRGGSGTTARANAVEPRRRSRSASDEIAEELVPFERELSISRVRGRDGETRSGRSSRTSTATESSASRARRRAGRAAGRGRGARARAARRARATSAFSRSSSSTSGAAARERARSPRPQHGPLDDRGRGHEPVREPPAGDPRSAARVDRRNRPGGDGEPRRRLAPARGAPRAGRRPRPSLREEQRRGRKLGHATFVGADEETVALGIALVESAADG